MTEKQLLARENFKKGYSCAQAVACAFCTEMGMTEQQAARFSSSFGGGMGRLREVCGAVSAALLVLGAAQGYADPEDHAGKAAHYARVQDFAARFRAAHETIICRELLKNLSIQKMNNPEPERRTEEYYRVRPCVVFVETAAGILEEMLREGAEKQENK